MSVENPTPSHHLFQDLTGKKFGYLLVVSFSHKKVYSSKGHAFFWHCQCDCGRKYPQIKPISGGHLRSGHTVSCGCKTFELVSEKNTTHGHAGTKTRTYRCWLAMRSRCNPDVKCKHKLKHYAGRGISVCDRWESFESFLADMGDAQSEKHELDRFPDRNGNYEPGNVRWATKKEQMRNHGGNTVIECDGEKKCIAEWSEISGVKGYRISARILSGWDAKKAIFTMPKSYR